MSNFCELTGKLAVSGKKVSHSNIKTNRRFAINVKKTSLVSKALGSKYNINISVSTARTIDKYGSFDSYLLGIKKAKLTDFAKIIRNKVIRTTIKQNGTIIFGAKRKKQS